MNETESVITSFAEDARLYASKASGQKYWFALITTRKGARHDEILFKCRNTAAQLLSYAKGADMR